MITLNLNSNIGFFLCHFCPLQNVQHEPQMNGIECSLYFCLDFTGQPLQAPHRDPARREGS